MPAEPTLQPPLGRPADFKALYRKLERTLARIEATDDRTILLETVLAALVRDFRVDLGFEMGRLYARDEQGFFLCCTVGGARPAPIGRRVPDDYPPHVQTLREGLLVMRRGEAGFDDAFERGIGVTSTFAAIAVGPGPSYVLAFSVDGELHEERILYSLTAVRHVINLKLEERKLSGILEEARIIQESLLPARPPLFAGFEFHGVSRPAEQVGGDVYDFLPLPRGGLGIAVADSSGHGLPAALLARDVVTALRLLAEEHLGPARLMARVNRVIHRAALSSRFISLFWAELRPGGALAYCNAGHPPALLRRGRTLRELARGGLILGPSPEAAYAIGRARLEPGDILCIASDGIVEQRNRAGREFGWRRWRQAVRDLPDAPASVSAEALLAAADAFRGGEPAADDQTVVVVRRV